MAEYKVCENCKKVVEYSTKTKYEGGTSYRVFECPKCGYIKKSNINHVHYGNDDKK